MKNNVRLFINNEELEFSSDPQILLNYKETELHNPTIVRNSFTKQITVQGTNRNNDIFGHIWNLDRIQGDNFNPIKKTDFQLFVNDELFQKGYCKLDKITRTTNTVEYSLTLYGSLGQFFYSLSYDQDDSSNAKKTLADLKFHDEWSQEPDLDFDINMDAVYAAWGRHAGYDVSADGKWNVINFIPAYDGIPGDFDATKVLINNYQINSGGSSGFRNSASEGGVNYRPVLNGVINQSGYTLGEMEKEMTCWETRDLRSYLQRPCVSMKKIIDACCQPDNNGGYKVELDPHFFNIGNPYYYDAWVTLPLLKDLEGLGGGETYNLTGATLGARTTQYGAYMYPVEYNSSQISSINNVNMSLSIHFTPDSPTTATSLYTNRVFKSKNVVTVQPLTYVKQYESNCGVVVQMFAYGSGGDVVGQSKAYLLGGNKYYPSSKNSKEPLWNYFYRSGNDIGVTPEYEYLEGYWKKLGGEFVFVDKNGNPKNINFTFQAPNDFVTLVLKVKQPKGEYIKYFWSGAETRGDSTVAYGYLYPSTKYQATGKYTKSEAANTELVRGSWNYNIESMEATATDYEGLFSGTRITKQRLLTTEYSPAEYLLAYCKIFGLYFYFDSTEEADDTEKYPSGVVHIMDRDTFYTDEVADLSKMIDWDKKVTITPAMADAKWYRFDIEHVESEAEQAYKQQYGKDYGSQLVNTNYNFDSNTTDLYDGNVFKAGIMVLEKDKYFRKNSLGMPTYMYNGLTYNLFAAGDDEFDTYEISYPGATTQGMDPINENYELYDAFPKLQFHMEDNSPSDGSNVLVFLHGLVTTDADYYITDDVVDMATLNDGTPCWILTRSEQDAAGHTIAKKINSFPYFTRDIIQTGITGNIIHSWNFGHPQVTYVPDTYTTEWDSIYDVCWKNYIRDLYNVDTRKLTCYVRAEFDGRPWPYWLRRYYWFENSIWRLNEIKDLNVGDFETTQMEFIKVQDMNDYKLDKIEYQGKNSITLDSSAISCTGGVITGKVYMQGGGAWAAYDILSGIDGEGNSLFLETRDVMYPVSGSGSVTDFTLTLPSNSGSTPINWEIKVEDSQDIPYTAYLTQLACSDGSSIEISPSTVNVSYPSGSVNISIDARNVGALSVVKSADWFTATLSGNTLVITYQTNSGANRYGTFTVSATGIQGIVSATGTISQSGVEGINVSTSEITYDYFETTGETLTVYTQGPWTSTINDN